MGLIPDGLAARGNIRLTTAQSIRKTAVIWGRVFILYSVYISHKSPCGHQAFFSENEEISSPPPCRLLIGIYKFYENWSTETVSKLDKTGF